MVFRSIKPKHPREAHKSLTIGEIENLYFAGSCGCGHFIGYGTKPDHIIHDWQQHRSKYAN